MPRVKYVGGVRDGQEVEVPWDKLYPADRAIYCPDDANYEVDDLQPRTSVSYQWHYYTLVVYADGGPQTILQERWVDGLGKMVEVPVPNPAYVEHFVYEFVDKGPV